MLVLAVGVLLSAAGTGSAQLALTTTDVETTTCNKTVVLPCYVTDLQENSEKAMIVLWALNDKDIFSYEGASHSVFRDPAFPSANLLSPGDLLKGVASLTLSSAEAEVGNYTCQVTESNREGKVRVELKSRVGSWFPLVERAIIIVLLFLIIVLCSAQLSVVAFKYEIVPEKKVSIAVAGFIFTVAAVVGTVLYVQDGFTAQNQAGLGLIVIPAVSMVPLQYFIFRIVFDSLPQATFALIGLHILGYVIAVVGFALCVSACPPSHGSILIAGLAIMAITNLLSLAYVFIMGSRMKDHPRPGKAVEEPLNDAKGVMLE
ncbi:leukocyte surface antigen CD47 isoform X6 [Melanerpes formicivorus]|uniref:leukocyte surface antigen CD47 isoform X6 n=1 Tax=Melanerpes formicivorus TaxID=211600 RepID=UPI00358E7BB8